MKPKPTGTPTRKTVTCPSCYAKVTISAQSDWRCPACTLAFCPFCQLSIIDGCEHVVASEADDLGWNRSPFEGITLPHLPEELNVIAFDRTDLDAAFGPKAPLVEEVWGMSSGEYCGEPDAGESQHALFREIADEMENRVAASSWEVVGSGFTSSGGRDYFALDREKVVAHTRAFIEDLRRGFGKLEGIGREALAQQAAGR